MTPPAQCSWTCTTMRLGEGKGRSKGWEPAWLQGLLLAQHSSVQPPHLNRHFRAARAPRGVCILLPFLAQHCADYPEPAPASVEGYPSLPYSILCSLLFCTDPSYDSGNNLFCLF